MKNLPFIHEKINYIELATKNLKKSEIFFKSIFSWEFEYYGEDYLAFYGAGIDGGFYLAGDDLEIRNTNLIVFYSE